MGRQNVKRKILTPQEKKLLSYVKDTRNTYGESSRSRVSIAKNKTYEHQILRHGQKLILKQILKVQSEEIEIVEAEMKSVKRRRWRKCPDTPLGAVVSGKLKNLEFGGAKIESKRTRVLKTAKKRWKPLSRYSRWDW